MNSSKILDKKHNSTNKSIDLLAIPSTSKQIPELAIPSSSKQILQLAIPSPNKQILELAIPSTSNDQIPEDLAEFFIDDFSTEPVIQQSHQPAIKIDIGSNDYVQVNASQSRNDDIHAIAPQSRKRKLTTDHNEYDERALKSSSVIFQNCHIEQLVINNNSCNNQTDETNE